MRTEAVLHEAARFQRCGCRSFRHEAARRCAMKLHVVPRRGAVAGVQARLQEQITAGDYKPSERLPSQSELCKTFGVSGPVIREALMSLQALGLTTSQPGIGTFIVSDSVRVPLL